jgi:transcriptional regulator with XRE-family HTH domain
MFYGKKIREIRIQLGKNQKEMAKDLGVSQSYLCEVEGETKRPNGELILELINRFHVSAFWLKNGTGPVFVQNEDVHFINACEVSDNKRVYNFNLLNDFPAKNDTINLDDLLFLRVDSDNMLPEIRKNDFVIIDTSIKTLDAEGVYLFETNNKKMIRQLLLIPQKHLVSTNPCVNESSIIFDCSINCIGKLVRLSRDI